MTKQAILKHLQKLVDSNDREGLIDYLEKAPTHGRKAVELLMAKIRQELIALSIMSFDAQNSPSFAGASNTLIEKHMLYIWAITLAMGRTISRLNEDLVSLGAKEVRT